MVAGAVAASAASNGTVKGPWAPPPLEQSILAAGLEVFSRAEAGAADPADGPEGVDMRLVGDFSWSSEDGSTEAFLRVRPDGQWWHAAHCFGGAPTAAAADAWEMAEALGSWFGVPVPGDAVNSTSPGVALVLLCETFRWARGSASPADGWQRAPARLRPTAEGRRDMDAAVGAGHLLLCYAVRAVGEDRQLELVLPQGPPSRLKPMLAAVESLGFAHGYDEACAGDDDSEPDDPAWSVTQRSSGIDTVFLPAPLPGSPEHRGEAGAGLLEALRE